MGIGATGFARYVQLVPEPCDEAFLVGLETSYRVRSTIRHDGENAWPVMKG
jgi:hypothetical protein